MIFLVPAFSALPPKDSPGGILFTGQKDVINRTAPRNKVIDRSDEEQTMILSKTKNQRMINKIESKLQANRKTTRRKKQVCIAMRCCITPVILVALRTNASSTHNPVENQRGDQLTSTSDRRKLFLTDQNICTMGCLNSKKQEA